MRTAVIGCGTMGRAIATGLLRARVIPANTLLLADRVPGTAETLAHELGATAAPDAAAAAAGAEVVLLCVKPGDVAPALTALTHAGALTPRSLLISIAAGVTTHAIETLIGPTIPVVRAMPNTPCRIGAGMTVVTAGSAATTDHLALARRYFEPLGRCITLEEKHFDAVTAVSASGPAFIYVVIEALADGAVQCGLPRPVATELVAQATMGAARMVLETGTHPAALKDDVTTPAGCTIAGLLSLEDARVRSALARAVETTAHVAAGLGGKVEQAR
jgi:pyrroline-5-carboxylate reductase